MLVLLDNDNYFTGMYAKVGILSNGISVDSLPNDLTNHKTTCWKLIITEVQITTSEPEYELDENFEIKIDPLTGEPIIKLDEEGNVVYVIQTQIQKSWEFDNEKYQRILDEVNLLQAEKTNKEKLKDLQNENELLLTRVSTLQEVNASQEEVINANKIIIDDLSGMVLDLQFQLDTITQ